MTNSQKQYEVLRWASLFLEKHNRESRVAEILLQHHLNVTRSEFYMMMQDPVPKEIVVAFQSDVEQHAMTGIPVQHLTGYESFYDRNFSVNKHVLIPRPETEELVQHIIQSKEAQNRPLTIADIGTGSGIIAITLALELPDATVYASDISTDALRVAKQNAENLKAKVHFLQGDYLQPIIDEQIKADIIVSNPPYIAKTEAPSLSDTVKNFDPELALFAEDNGLAAYETIIHQSATAARQEAMLAFEIGHAQSVAVHKLIEATFPGSNIKTIQDINGKDRIVSATIRNKK